MSRLGPDQWIRCKCGSTDVQSIMICTIFGRGVLTTCKKCGFRVEYRKLGGQVREFVHLRKGETMQTATLKSDALRTAAFDPDRDVIRLEFTNGSVYEYWVDPAAEEPPNIRVLYLSLIHSEDAGKFFGQFIRPKTSKLLYKRMPADPQPPEAA